jgi:ParB family transcriptional regulator, chromosome partitioning protein
MSNEKKSRLGRGLDALLGGEDVPVAAATPTSRTEVAVEAIETNPYQPRKQFDDEELESLGESIRNHGILQPLVVRQVGERFQLIAGERRLRAAQAVGMAAVPVTVVDFNDQQVLEAALVENIQRADLNPIEKAQGFKEYLDRYHMTHEQLAARLGMARPSITNLVALLDLPIEVQAMVKRGELSQGHAKVLKGLSDPLRQLSLSKEIVARGLSVHATEALVKQTGGEDKSAESNGGGGESKSAPEKTAHVKSIEDELRQKLGVKIEIKVKSKEKGQVVLSFDSNDDFERLVEALRK